jgi:hypothetical protein
MNNPIDPIYGNDNVNLYLYHYTKFETALKILDSKKLKFNNYGTSNDPYESKKLYFTVLKATYENNNIFINHIDNARQIQLLNEYKIICFSQDKSPLGKLSLFNRGCCLLSLWALYADNHKGVCLVFDRFDLCKEVNQQHLSNWPMPVSYEELLERHSYIHRMAITTIYQKGNIDIYDQIKVNIHNNPGPMFFLKDKNWEHENEFRIVLFNIKNDEETFVNITNSLKGIIIGTELDYESTSKLKILCDNLGIFTRRFIFRDEFYLTENILPVK